MLKYILYLICVLLFYSLCLWFSFCLCFSHSFSTNFFLFIITCVLPLCLIDWLIACMLVCLFPFRSFLNFIKIQTLCEMAWVLSVCMWELIIALTIDRHFSLYQYSISLECCLKIKCLTHCISLSVSICLCLCSFITHISFHFINRLMEKIQQNGKKKN